MSGFSLDSYRELLLAFKDAQYAFCMFEEVEQHQAEKRPFVILRHDIDISLRAALEVAQVEHAAGIQATYFVALNSPFYNVLSSASAAMLLQLHEMGHQVALHVDLKMHADDYACALGEVEILRKFYPYINTQLVSLHSPISLDETLIESFPQLKNVYGHFFNKEVAYISDSTGRWRYGHPHDSESFYLRKPIQLLTHPIWWVQDGESPTRKLEYWLQQDYVHTLSVAREYLPKLYK